MEKAKSKFHKHGGMLKYLYLNKSKTCIMQKNK